MTDAASALAPAARTSPTGHDGARTPAASNPRPASVTARCPCCAAVPVIRDPVCDGPDFAPRVHGTRWPTLRDVVLSFGDAVRLWADDAAQRVAPPAGEVATAGGGVGGHAASLPTADAARESAS